ASVRCSAAFALGKTGPLAVVAIPRLTRALKDDHAGVREAAAFALGEIGPAAWEDTFPALVELLAGDKDPLVRRSAACALGKLGREALQAEDSPANAVLSALEKGLSDASATVRQNAAWALGRLAPKKGRGAVPHLAKALADPEPVVRREVATALGE